MVQLYMKTNWKKIPLLNVLSHKTFQNISQTSIHNLGLTVCLWMVKGVKLKCGSNFPSNGTLKWLMNFDTILEVINEWHKMHKGQCHWENMVVTSPYPTIWENSACLETCIFLLTRGWTPHILFKGISMVLWHTNCEHNKHHTLKIYI